MGLVAPGPGDAGDAHGVLLVSGFLGTLIGLERAVVTRRWWAELAPALSAAGALAIVLGAPAPLPALLIALAAVVLVAVGARGAPVTPPLARALLAAAALGWLGGALLLAQAPPPFRLVPWWLLFVVLAIVAERMDLSRAVRPSSSAAVAVVLICALFAAGTLLTLADLAAGLRVAGVAALLIAAWLAWRDRPVRAAHPAASARFSALAISLAYAWLAAGALLLLTYAPPPAGWQWDATVHAFFVGFAVSMIFAHGPIVIPGVIGSAITFSRLVFVPFTLLELSVLARIAGDLLHVGVVRDLGAIGIAAAFVLYAIVLGRMLRARSGATRGAVAGAGLR